MPRSATVKGTYFYPRSPCGERPLRSPRIALMVGFLSTLSLRRATQQAITAEQTARISIHALLAESDSWNRRCQAMAVYISIHALLAESDKVRYPWTPLTSTISIHALLAESDVQRGPWPHQWRHFYPRSPCGERPHLYIACRAIRHFYPRSPCGERPQVPKQGFGPVNFYPRSPCGERLDMSSAYPAAQCISIHALLAESDRQRELHRQDIPISIHALLAESDPSLRFLWC